MTAERFSASLFAIKQDRLLSLFDSSDMELFCGTGELYEICNGKQADDFFTHSGHGSGRYEKKFADFFSTAPPFPLRLRFSISEESSGLLMNLKTALRGFDFFRFKVSCYCKKPEIVFDFGNKDFLHIEWIDDFLQMVCGYYEHLRPVFVLSNLPLSQKSAEFFYRYNILPEFRHLGSYCRFPESTAVVSAQDVLLREASIKKALISYELRRVKFDLSGVFTKLPFPVIYIAGKLWEFFLWLRNAGIDCDFPGLNNFASEFEVFSACDCGRSQLTVFPGYSLSLCHHNRTVLSEGDFLSGFAGKMMALPVFNKDCSSCPVMAFCGGGFTCELPDADGCRRAALFYRSLIHLFVEHITRFKYFAGV